MALDVTIGYDGFRKLDPLTDVSPSHLLRVQSGQASRSISIDISRSGLVPLNHRLGSARAALPDPVLLAGLSRLEKTILLGVPVAQLPDIRFLSTDVDEILNLWHDPPQCEWQIRVGRTYICNAAHDWKARATTPADCRACTVPDTRWICADFVHPIIKNVGVMGDPRARMLFDAQCNRGNNCAGGNCQPGGNTCWSRLLTPVRAPTNKPTAVVDPGRPFSNRQTLIHMVEEAEDYIWWYERQMPARVLDVLADGIPQSSVRSIRILSGPLGGTREKASKQLGRFRQEFAQLTIEWRELPTADQHHDRIFLDSKRALNIPPLNTVLKGDTSEFLPSNLDSGWFESLWQQASSL